MMSEWKKLDISNTTIDAAIGDIRYNFIKLGYDMSKDYYLLWNMENDSLRLKVYNHKMFQDKKVKELLLEYLI
jgi:hypothetical protein